MGWRNDSARTQAEYDELGPPIIAMEPIRSSTGTIHGPNGCGKPRYIGTGDEAGIVVYGGAGYYGFSCDCEPERVHQLSGKPGESSDIENHLAFCTLRNNCFGCLLPFPPDEAISCYDRLWHQDCLLEEDARMREVAEQVIGRPRR